MGMKKVLIAIIMIVLFALMIKLDIEGKDKYYKCREQGYSKTYCMERLEM